MAISYLRLTIAADQAKAVCTNLQMQCATASPVEFMVIMPLLAKANELSSEIGALLRAVEASKAPQA